VIGWHKSRVVLSVIERAYDIVSRFAASDVAKLIRR
jgi:hypothetical protein